MKLDINDLTYLINGAIFEVNRGLGAGFLEKVYENALLVELSERGLRAENQVPIEVKFDACLGYLSGVVSACCGHGVTEPLIFREGEL